MKQGNAQLLLNCPKCGSNRLMFVRPVTDSVYIECMDCKYHKDDAWDIAMKAAQDWNER